MERSTIFNGNIHYFDWAIFHCYVSSPEGNIPVYSDLPHHVRLGQDWTKQKRGAHCPTCFSTSPSSQGTWRPGSAQLSAPRKKLWQPIGLGRFMMPSCPGESTAYRFLPGGQVGFNRLSNGWPIELNSGHLMILMQIIVDVDYIYIWLYISTTAYWQV